MKLFTVIALILVSILLSSCLESTEGINRKEEEKNEHVDIIAKSRINEQDLEEVEELSNSQNIEEQVEYTKELPDKDLLFSSELLIHESGLMLRFELYGKNKEKVEQINIIDVKEDILLDSIFVEDSRGMITESYGFYINDYNFDDYKDIRLQGVGGSGANTTFSYWLWDSDTKRFLFNEEYLGLTQEFFDYENQFVISVNSCCAGASYIEEVFRVNEDNSLTLYKILCREWNDETKKFDFSIYIHENGVDNLLYKISDDPEDGDTIKLESFWGKTIWYLEEY